MGRKSNQSANDLNQPEQAGNTDLSDTECYNITNDSPDSLIRPIELTGRQRSLANLKPPIKKGEVRNPMGNNGLEHRRTRMQASATEVADKALRILIKQLDSSDERIAQSAARELLDRGFGKSVQAVANTDSAGNDVPPPPPMVVIGVSGSK
jgi:hypothetical protein